MATFTVLGFFVWICVDNNVLAQTQYRLPTDIVPTKYTIDLKFPETTFSSSSAGTFTGQVTIDFKILNETENLKLHLSNVYIRVTKLTLNNNVLTRSQYNIDATSEIITIPDLIDVHKLVKDKSYSVVFEYTGRISNTDNYGVYKSSYTKSNGIITHLIATQFRATYARRVFPCFDEPSFKATFDVSISYTDNKDFGLNALFNTDEVASNSTAGLTTVTFKTTPIMSTYLITFVISDLTSTSDESIGDTKYTVWSTEDQATSRNYAATEGPKILNALNEYIGRNYGDEMTKIDHVALSDFYAGAMANWGLLIYRESYILCDEENTSDTARQSIATAIAHETSYQWFGNLITCEWWSESYLNEGFATYFEYFITHLVEPGWELDKQFVVNVLQPVMDLDSLEHLQSLKSNVSSPEEIDNTFRQISYGKGGSVLRMLSHIMGEEHFKEAVQAYVNTTELQHSTSTTSKFLEIFQTKVNPQYSAIDANSSITLAEIMKNWIEQPGYPLLTVSLNGTNLTVYQERFLVSGEDKNSKWYVPITIAESESEFKFQVTATSAWLTPDSPEIIIELEHNNGWVLLNVLSTGFYRVNYDKDLWTSITEALQNDNFDGIVDLNRAQIVDDAFNLVKANKLTYTEVFDIIAFLKKDVSYFPWVPAFTGFEYIIQKFPSNSVLKTKLQEHLLTLMDALYKSVPISETKDDQIYTLTQTLANSWACLLGEKNCVSQAKKLFDESLNSGTCPNKNIRSLVYCTALRYSTDTNDYDYLWNLYSTSIGSSEKIDILKALGCSTNPEKLKELLTETVKSDSQIRTQDSITAFSAVYSGSDVGVDVALEFLIDNFDAVLTKFTAIADQSSIIIEIASRLTTTEQINKLKTFMESNSKFQGDLKELSEKAITQAESNLEWLTTHQAALNKYLGITDGTDGADTITANLAALVVVNIIMLFGF